MPNPVDLDFRSDVPVFDANVALGRRHDRRVPAETPGDLLAEMDRFGIDRALVYCQHAVTFDAVEGNRMLLEMIAGHRERLVPQFVFNPAYDDLPAFVKSTEDAGVRSVRMAPTQHKYPLRSWVAGDFIAWAAGLERPRELPQQPTPIWISAFDVDPSQLADMLETVPALTVVLCEPHYTHIPWIIPLLRSRSNLRVEISRAVIGDAIPRLIEAAGHSRVLHGSWWPEGSLAAQLYALHRCGLDQEQLMAICARNLDHLLGAPSPGGRGQGARPSGEG
ncbi:MAG: amidohydrolase family protein [Dehalococcoidia bacterium]|nr:amidohydrolase family protein [Dehalococcoidia bacterium]